MSRASSLTVWVSASWRSLSLSNRSSISTLVSCLCRLRLLNFLQCRQAPLAYSRIPLVCAYMHGVIPAALALLARGFVHFYAQWRISVPARSRLYLSARDNHQEAQIVTIALQQSI